METNSIRPPKLRTRRGRRKINGRVHVTTARRLYLLPSQNNNKKVSASPKEAVWLNILSRKPRGKSSALSAAESKSHDATIEICVQWSLLSQYVRSKCEDATTIEGQENPGPGIKGLRCDSRAITALVFFIRNRGHVPSFFLDICHQIVRFLRSTREFPRELWGSRISRDSSKLWGGWAGDLMIVAKIVTHTTQERNAVFSASSLLDKWYQPMTG